MYMKLGCHGNYKFSKIRGILVIEWLSCFLPVPWLYKYLKKSPSIYRKQDIDFKDVGELYEWLKVTGAD